MMMLATVPILLLLDLPYLYLVGQHYFESLGLRTYVGGFITYCLLALGLDLVQYDPVNSFILGLIIYGVYDATNYATLSQWSLSFALMDTLWGALLMWMVAQIHRNWLTGAIA